MGWYLAVFVVCNAHIIKEYVHWQTLGGLRGGSTHPPHSALFACLLRPINNGTVNQQMNTLRMLLLMSPSSLYLWHTYVDAACQECMLVHLSVESKVAELSKGAWPL